MDRAVFSQASKGVVREVTVFRNSRQKPCTPLLWFFYKFRVELLDKYDMLWFFVLAFLGLPVCNII